jgi:serine/threonine-protein kinase RsbT
VIEADRAGPAEGVVRIVGNQDIVRVRQAVRSAAVEARLSLVDQTKVITAASELARNTLTHGGGGRAELRGVSNGRRAGVRVEFVDHGPGIVDLEAALTDGFTTGNGLGLGLSGARRLVDEFEIETAPGEGTRVTVVKWSR